MDETKSEGADRAKRIVDVSLRNRVNPGYGPEHFNELMAIDKVAVAMYGYLYDELSSEEEQDLVIAHCLGLDVVWREEGTDGRRRDRDEVVS